MRSARARTRLPCGVPSQVRDDNPSRSRKVKREEARREGLKGEAADGQQRTAAKRGAADEAAPRHRQKREGAGREGAGRACCMGVATQNCTKGSSSWMGLMRCAGPTHQPVCARRGESGGCWVVGRGGGWSHRLACVRWAGALGGCGGRVRGGAGRGSRLPAGDGEGLAGGGDGERALEHARQRREVLVRLARVDGVLVDLVRDDEQPGVAADHLGHLRHLCGAEGLARGVVRRVEHEHLGARRDLRRARHQGMGERRAGALVRRCGGAKMRSERAARRRDGAPAARWCDGAAWWRGGGVAAEWRCGGSPRPRAAPGRACSGGRSRRAAARKAPPCRPRCAPGRSTGRRPARAAPPATRAAVAARSAEQLASATDGQSLRQQRTSSPGSIRACSDMYRACDAPTVVATSLIGSIVRPRCLLYR